MPATTGSMMGGDKDGPEISTIAGLLFVLIVVTLPSIVILYSMGVQAIWKLILVGVVVSSLSLLVVYQLKTNQVID